MTGLPDYNYPYFNRVAHIIREKYQDKVFNPAEAFEGNTDLPRDTYLRHDIEVLLHVDAIVMLPGWTESKGAILELWIAKELDLDTWRWDDELGLLKRLPIDSAVSLIKAATLKDSSCCCELPN